MRKRPIDQQIFSSSYSRYRNVTRHGVVDSIEMSDVAADVAAVAAVLAADTTDVLFAAKAADYAVCPAGRARPKAEHRRAKADLLRA